jgi:hypothetical protein
MGRYGVPLLGLPPAREYRRRWQPAGHAHALGPVAVRTQDASWRDLVRDPGCALHHCNILYEV